MIADVLLRDVWQLRAKAFIVACVETEYVDDSLGVLERYELFFQEWWWGRTREVLLEFYGLEVYCDLMRLEFVIWLCLLLLFVFFFGDLMLLECLFNRKLLLYLRFMLLRLLF